MKASAPPPRPRSSGARRAAAGLPSLLPAALLLAGALAAAGCIALPSPELTAMKDTIESDLVDADFDREFGMTFGRMSLGLGKFVLNRLGDEDEDLNMLRGVKKVEVGHYVADLHRDWRESRHGDRLDLAPDGEGPGEPLGSRLESLMRQRGWTAAVAARDGLSRTWVYYRTNQREDRIRGVYVIALEGDELTLVRLTGRLDRTLRAAMSLSRQYAAGEDPL